MKNLAPDKDSVLREYIRDDDKTPIGLVVGQISSEGDILIGFSLCHKGDEWDKSIGYLVAWARLSVAPFTLLEPHVPNGALTYQRKRDRDRLRILKVIPYVRKMRERLEERQERLENA